MFPPVPAGSMSAADRRSAWERNVGQRENFDVHGGGFVITGPDDATVAAGMESGAAPYRFLWVHPHLHADILALHGLQDLGLKLHLHVGGRPLGRHAGAQVSDDVVRIFAACGTYPEIAGGNRAALRRRPADFIDLEFPTYAPIGLRRDVLADIQRIPHCFTGFVSGE